MDINIDELYNDLLSELITSSAAVVDEKLEMFSEYLYNMSYIEKKYESSPLLNKILDYVNNNYISYFTEANKEHDMYDLFYAVINTNDNLDMDFFNYVDEIFDTFEEAVIIRDASYVEFVKECQEIMYKENTSVINNEIYKPSINYDNYNKIFNELKKLIKINRK